MSMSTDQFARVRAALSHYDDDGANADPGIRDALADLIGYCISEDINFEQELRIARANAADEWDAADLCENCEEPFPRHMVGCPLQFTNGRFSE